MKRSAARSRAKDGLALPVAPQAQWKHYARRFERCLKAWKFLLPARSTFAVLGRNAHGSILVLQDGDNELGGQIGVLDATVVRYTTHADWMFPSLFSQLLPDRVLDLFCDDSAFGEWRSVAKAIGVSLEGDSILGLRQPLSLGGTMTAGNLVVADLFEYYESTAEVLANLR